MGRGFAALGPAFIGIKTESIGLGASIMIVGGFSSVSRA
jgi:hypothetical protein